MLRSRCPKCLEDQEIQDNQSGQTVKCSNCGASYTAPFLFRPNNAAPSVSEEKKADSYSNWHRRQFLDNILFYLLFIVLAVAGLYGARKGWSTITGNADHDNAMLFYSKAQWKDAISSAQAALKKDPKSKEFKQTLGLAHLEYGKSQKTIGEYETSIESLEKACEILDDNNAANRELAYAYLHASDKSKAVKQFRHSLKMAPEDTVARQQLGMILAETGAYKEASVEFKKLMDNDDENYTAKLAYAICLDSMGETENAQKLLTRIVNDNPSMTEAAAKLEQISAREADKFRRLHETPDFTFKIVEQTGFPEVIDGNNTFYFMFRFKNTSGHYFSKVTAQIEYYGFDKARKVLLHTSNPIPVENIDTKNVFFVEDRVLDSEIASRVRTQEIRIHN